MKENLLGIMSNGDCIALVSPKSLQWFNINGYYVESKAIELSKNVDGVKLVLCDPFGQYILFVGEEKVYIVYLEAKLFQSLSGIDNAALSVEEIDVTEKSKSIVCVKCHPRLSSCFCILLDDGTFLQYDPYIQRKPIGKTSLKLTEYPSVAPLSFSFGCNKGSDQFALYITYENGFVGLINPLPLEGYSLSKLELASLWKDCPLPLRNWLNGWNETNSGNYSPSTENCTTPITILSENQLAEKAQTADLFVEVLENDVIIIQQVCNSTIRLFARSVYESKPEAVLLTSLSTQSLAVHSIMHDSQPHSFFLLSDSQIFSLTFPWISTFLSTKKVGDYLLHSLHKHSNSYSKNTIVINNPYQGHCILHLEKGVELKVLRLVNTPSTPLLQCTGSSSSPLYFSKELNKEIGLLQNYQTNQTFHHFIQQVNTLSFSDSSLDNAISVDILNQYQIPYIMQLAKIKEAIVQTTEQIRSAIKQAEEKREKLAGLIDKEKEENASLLEKLMSLLKEQQGLDVKFERVVRKMQELINQEGQQDDQLKEGMQVMIQLLQKLQVHIQQAVYVITSAESLKKHVRDVDIPAEQEEVNNEMIGMLEAIQKNLLKANNLKKENKQLLKEYEQCRQSHSIMESI